MNKTTSYKGTILVIDDIPNYLNILPNLLTKAGFKVFLEQNGEGGLKKAKFAHPDLILLEVMMSGMDGFEVCQHLKLQEETQDIPIILMTATAEPINKVKVFKLGAVDYITKPFQPEEVLARVNTQMNLRKLQHQFIQQNQQLQPEITKCHSLEKALHESEKRFELAMRATNEGFWDWDIETNEVYYSPRWKQILGYTESELSNHADEFFKRLHPEEQRSTTEKVTTYLEKQIPTYDVTFRLQHKEGHYVWILSRGVAVFNEQGKPIRMVGTHLDLTTQKQTEEALYHAKEAAEVANRAKSAFLANMSHELRTPLNSILGYAQVFLKNNNLNAKQQEGLAVIQRSGEYLLTLINDVLDLSKIETNRIELFPTDFYFHGFLKGINELFQMRAEQQEIAFRYQALTQLPMMIYADERRLRQILINLLSNAVKFTEQGEVTFKVSLTQQHLSSKILFQVEDTGIGIALEDRDKLFLPFQQVGERNYQTQGTGLGLALSKKLVEMMGGELHIESTLGQGSVFWMELDLPKVSNVKPEPTDKPVITGIEGTPRTVLVVDDQLGNRSLLINLLAPLGFKILEACNGQESVEKARQNRPDVIFMDLVMPEMDGFEATRQIRKIPELKEVVIIAISASIFDFHRQQSLASYNDFIAKPFSREVLLKILQKHLNFQLVYEYTAETNHIKQQTDVPIKGPSPEQATILFEFTLRGDIDSIIEYVETLERTDADLQAFATKIKKLAENLKIKKIREIVKRYKEETPQPDISTAVPTAEQATILFDLAMKGDVYGLHNYIEQLEQSDEKLAPFVGKIRPLAKQFQYDKICKIVQPYT